MRKETVLAIVAGVSIGLITAFGIWRVTTAIKKNATESEIANTPVSVPDKDFSFVIANLSDFDVVTQSPMTINGMTKPLSNIIISTFENDFFGTSKEDGSFEVKVELPVSLSEIKAVNFDSDGNSSETNIKIVFSEEFKKYVETTKKSKAYVGTVTDISGDTIQIKSANGEILQAGVVEETTYVNLLKKAIAVKKIDLAIGDYVVAMGLLNGNKVLSAKRILITSELVDLPAQAGDKRQIAWGKISKITKTKLTIVDSNEKTLEISLPKKWNGPNVSELEVGQEIIVVGTRDNDNYILRSIFTPTL